MTKNSMSEASTNFKDPYENLPTITLGEKTYRILRHDAIKGNNGEIERNASYYILLNEFEDQIYFQTPFGKSLENEVGIRKKGFGGAVDAYTFEKYETPQIFQKKLKKEQSILLITRLVGLPF